MGTISKGILGGFSGKVGTVIGGSWKGITYMRSLATRRSNTATQPQLEHRAKFSLAMRFIATLSALFSISFRNFASKMTGPNSAFSYLLKNAITGTYPSYVIDYSKVLISRGDLPNAGNPTATATAGSTVHFAWTSNAGIGKAKPNDGSILVVYCPSMNQVFYTTQSGTREDQGEDIVVTMFHGKVVETWVGFISADGKEIATSIFTGQLTVS